MFRFKVLLYVAAWLLLGMWQNDEYNRQGSKLVSAFLPTVFLRPEQMTLRTAPPSRFVQPTWSSTSHSLMVPDRSGILIANAHARTQLTSTFLVNGSQTLISASTGKLTPSSLSPFSAAFIKLGMITFIASMCFALPLTLYPQKILYHLGLIGRVRKERWALATAQFCTRFLIRAIPFTKLEAIASSAENSDSKETESEPQPAIWACNHQSMLDVFFLMAVDLRLRGRNKRPIKIIYWQGLESNPITRLLFRQAGFIPVAMAANKPGRDNEYDRSSFKKLLTGCKQAFADGFDVALLPEGQLNPTPELGLLPVFGGAYTLAKLAKRPIHLMALYGTHLLWHPTRGMDVQDRTVKIRSYYSDGDPGHYYESADEFRNTFETVVGHFGTTGEDLAPPEKLKSWLSGAAWRQLRQKQSEISTNEQKEK